MMKSDIKSQEENKCTDRKINIPISSQPEDALVCERSHVRWETVRARGICFGANIGNRL